MMGTGSPEVLRISDATLGSAETSFRELDDAFLQTQTRIWLGEVLHIRFDEETTVADLLADGELLFQVSKVIWKLLLKKSVDLKDSNAYIHERTSFGKSEGRYMPYTKVASFLKICQILGLTGIDMFSPSDVVEKRDVRRVCMCIRSLSKKARLKDLKVPDFDVVTYTIAMPTEMVGGIRRYLEQARHGSPSSSSCSSSMDSRELYSQRRFSFSRHFAQYHDSYSESDEAESAYAEFNSPVSNASYDDAKLPNLVGDDSPEARLFLDANVVDSQDEYHLNCRDKREDGHISGHPGSCYSAESADTSLACECRMDTSAMTSHIDMRDQSMISRTMSFEESHADAPVKCSTRDNEELHSAINNENVCASTSSTADKPNISLQTVNINPPVNHYNEYCFPLDQSDDLCERKTMQIEDQFNTMKECNTLSHDSDPNHSCEEKSIQDSSYDHSHETSKHLQAGAEVNSKELQTKNWSKCDFPRRDMLVTNALESRSDETDREKVSGFVLGKVGNVGLDHNITTEMQGLEKGGLKFPIEPNSGHTHHLNSRDDIVSRGIHSSNLEAPGQGRDSSSVAKSHSPPHDCVAKTSISMKMEEASMQRHISSSCLSPTSLTEMEVTTKQVIEVEDQILPSIGNADANKLPQLLDAFEDNKKFDNCEKELVAAKNGCGNVAKIAGDKDQKPGNRLLKSLAGGMTILGAVVLFIHLRQKRGREETVTLVPSKSQEQNQEISKQEEAEIGKSDLLQPRERPLKSKDKNSESLTQRQAAGMSKLHVLYPAEKLKL